MCLANHNVCHSPVSQAIDADLHPSLPSTVQDDTRISLSVSSIGNQSHDAKPMPLPKSAVRKLPWTRILPCDKAAFQHDDSDCSICCDRLIDGLTLTRLPCGHLFHFSCCLTWLVRNSSCPECRYELAALATHNSSTTSSENENIVDNDARRKEQSRLERNKDRRVAHCECKLPQVHTCFFVDDSKLLSEQLGVATSIKATA